MPNINLVLKALRLAWLPRLLNPVKQNWKSITDHFFQKLGGLNLLLRCNHNLRYLDPKLPNIFYRDILSFFIQIKSRLKQEDEQAIILFNNKEF